MRPVLFEIPIGPFYVIDIVGIAGILLLWPVAFALFNRLVRKSEGSLIEGFVFPGYNLIAAAFTYVTTSGVSFFEAMEKYEEAEVADDLRPFRRLYDSLVRIFLLVFAVVYVLQLFPSGRAWMFSWAPALYGRAGIAFYGAAILFGILGTLWLIRRLASSADLSLAKGWPLFIVPVAAALAFIAGDLATRGAPPSAVAVPAVTATPVNQGLLMWELPIHGYGFMIMLGFLSALTILAQRAKSVGYDPNIALDIGIIAMIGGIIGSRIAYIWTQPDQFLRTGEGDIPIVPHSWDLLKMVAIWNGGLVFYGGLILGGIGVMLFIRHLRLPLGLWTDMIAPTIPLAIGFARLGCFLNGCCYGIEASPGMPGFTYPPFAPIKTTEFGRGIEYSVPTQLYESMACFLLFFVTTWYFRRRKNFGTVLPFFAVFYGVFRYFIENNRADNTDPTKGELTTVLGITQTFSQWTSILLVSVGLVAFVAVTLTALKRRERQAAASSAPVPAAAAPAGSGS